MARCSSFFWAIVWTHLACMSIAVVWKYKNVTVEPGHFMYKELQKPSIPIYKAFYFFNLTNAEEFADAEGGIKPILKEVGPYSYREYREKTFLDGTRGPDTIGYKQTKMFFFDKNTSMKNASETDMICTINIPLVAALNMTKNSTILKTGLDAIVKVCKAKLFICKPAKELAWNYTDCLVQKLEELHQYPLKYVNIQVNNSAEDSKESIIHTGRTDITKIGQFVQWDGLRNLKIWGNGNGANDINGTEGFFFRPDLEEGDSLTVFVDDIKRSVDLVYTGKVNPLGMPAFRYGIDNRTFKSAFSEPENSRWGSWCPDGLIYLGSTQPKEIPVYGSKPHFLDGDPRLLDSIVGLKPDRVKHDTITDIEPITGAKLNFRRQLQINVQINRTTSYFPGLNQIHKIKGFNGTDTLYFPVLYINEHSTMDAAFKKHLEEEEMEEVPVTTEPPVTTELDTTEPLTTQPLTTESHDTTEPLTTDTTEPFTTDVHTHTQPRTAPSTDHSECIQLLEIAIPSTVGATLFVLLVVVVVISLIICACKKGKKTHSDSSDPLLSYPQSNINL